MLDALGYDDVDSLVKAAVPASIQVTQRSTTDIPAAATEAEALAELRTLASQNRVARPMIGLGYYDTLTPSVISRNVLENPSWYTAYTPYQPEISQGRLEALINFQTMVTDLTGLTTANASMLDESTAVVEGMLVARRGSRSASNVFVVDADTLPQTKALLHARAGAVGIELVELDLANGATFADASGAPVEPFGVLVQYPGASGRVWDPSGVIDAVHVSGGLAVVAADLLALTLLASPGSLGADVAVGTTQRFGVPLGFGGPHAGYMAVKQGLERQLPGRLVGVSQDAAGQPAYRLALQTREQHIRREKATSNICTAQVLLAVMASMYAVYHGPQGLKSIATSVARKAEALAARLRDYDLHLVSDAFFDTIRVATPGPAERVIDRARSKGYQLLWVDDATVGISVDETTTAVCSTAPATSPSRAARRERLGAGSGRRVRRAAHRDGCRSPAHHARRAGLRRRRLARQGRGAGIHPRHAALDERHPGRRDRSGGARRAAHAGVAEPRRAADDRPRLLRHPDAVRDLAERARESVVVHGLYALPARDLAGAARGAHQLPDDGDRSDRAHHRQRIDAR
jgi:glycine dehydrogenase